MIIELLLFKDKLDLMNYIYSLHVLTTYENIIKTHFDKQIIITKNVSGYIAYDLNNKIKNKNKKIKDNKDIKTILILDKNDNKWAEATPLNRIEIEQAMNPFDENDYKVIIGFMGYTIKNTDLAFKTTDLSKNRNTGAICSQANKELNLVKINSIVKENDTDADKYNKHSFKNHELCVFAEIILRYFDEINRNDRKWFLTPEMAIYHNLYTIF